MTQEEFNAHVAILSLREGDIIFFDAARIDGAWISELPADNYPASVAFVAVHPNGRPVAEALTLVRKEAV